MYGHRIYLEELLEKFLESDISGTRETNGVTKTGAAPLHKASSFNQKRRGRNCNMQRFLAALETRRSFSVTNKILGTNKSPVTIFHAE